MPFQLSRPSQMAEASNIKRTTNRLQQTCRKISRLYIKTLSMYAHIISLLVIYLRPLDYSREVNINRFPFGKDTQSLCAGFAVTVTGMLGTSER